MAKSDLRIDNFKANFDAGARPNRFKVNILGPNLFRAGEMTEAVQEETDEEGRTKSLLNSRPQKSP